MKLSCKYLIVGGGFIGSEIAAALAINRCGVSMIFPESGIGARIYPSKLAAFLNTYFREKGVTLLPGESVAAIQQSEKWPRPPTGAVDQSQVRQPPGSWRSCALADLMAGIRPTKTSPSGVSIATTSSY